MDKDREEAIERRRQMVPGLGLLLSVLLQKTVDSFLLLG